MRKVREIYRVVEKLKRRHAFVSLLMTNLGGVQISYWDGHEIKTGDPDSAKLHLKALDENDRRELEWSARRLFGGAKGKGGAKRANLAGWTGM